MKRITWMAFGALCLFVVVSLTAAVGGTWLSAGKGAVSFGIPTTAPPFRVGADLEDGEYMSGPFCMYDSSGEKMAEINTQGDVTVHGGISATSVESTGAVVGTSISTTGTASAATVAATTVTATTMSASGAASAASVAASGAVSCASVTASGSVAGNSGTFHALTATGATIDAAEGEGEAATETELSVGFGGAHKARIVANASWNKAYVDAVDITGALTATSAADSTISASVQAGAVSLVDTDGIGESMTVRQGSIQEIPAMTDPIIFESCMATWLRWDASASDFWGTSSALETVSANSGQLTLRHGANVARITADANGSRFDLNGGCAQSEFDTGTFGNGATFEASGLRIGNGFLLVGNGAIGVIHGDIGTSDGTVSGPHAMFTDLPSSASGLDPGTLWADPVTHCVYVVPAAE